MVFSPEICTEFSENDVESDTNSRECPFQTGRLADNQCVVRCCRCVRPGGSAPAHRGKGEGRRVGRSDRGRIRRAGGHLSLGHVRTRRAVRHRRDSRGRLCAGGLFLRVCQSLPPPRYPRGCGQPRHTDAGDVAGDRRRGGDRPGPSAESEYDTGDREERPRPPADVQCLGYRCPAARPSIPT